MLKYLFDKSVGNVSNCKCLNSCFNIFESIKILKEELVKAPKLKGLPRAEQWLQDRLVQKVSLPLQTLYADKDKRIDELEKLVEQMHGELGKEKKTICQLSAARLCAVEKIDELEKLVEQMRDKMMTGEKTITSLLSAARLCADEKTGSIAKSKRIDELERIIAKKDKKIRELEKGPTDAELDIRAKEGAKKHAEAKARLQKMYDERPVISLVVGESIGDLMVDKCISDLLVCM
jgi:chromosome segregation ATPase